MSPARTWFIAVGLDRRWRTFGATRWPCFECVVFTYLRRRRALVWCSRMSRATRRQPTPAPAARSSRWTRGLADSRTRGLADSPRPRWWAARISTTSFRSAFERRDSSRLHHTWWPLRATPSCWHMNATGKWALSASMNANLIQLPGGMVVRRPADRTATFFRKSRSSFTCSRSLRSCSSSVARRASRRAARREEVALAPQPASPTRTARHESRRAPARLRSAARRSGSPSAPRAARAQGSTSSLVSSPSPHPHSGGAGCPRKRSKPRPGRSGHPGIPASRHPGILASWR